MLSKKHRLAKTRDVQKAFARGRSFFNPLVTIRFLKNTDSTKRFTIVVSTKVSKKAVVRNRFKRVLREFIRLNLAGFVSGDYAVIVKPAAMKVEGKILLAEFRKLMEKSRLLL